MPEWLWAGSRLSWVFFGLVVYGLACVLAADVAWRLVTFNTRILLAIVGLGWIVGSLLILLVGV
ncbi:hypothetical protein [Salinisphaera sp. T31B1]|uniref:hypothetical protein n=1 Tax=Salinisphaera sp. T31B1 TaxID=727963 RepID=UPI003341CC7A